MKHSLAQGLRQLEGKTGIRSVAMFERGSLLTKVYAPRGTDPQTPHTRDEVYVVMQGSGEFVNGDERAKFAAGDLLFVPAGRAHRFEKFTDDLALWVVFYGPEGGEVQPGSTSFSS
jgi:mannose-6-phosphate isomerase-like protein (cupin superfamily)